jgi:pimeloyl-ACP methyl ester carboxylesterase
MRSSQAHTALRPNPKETLMNASPKTLFRRLAVAATVLVAAVAAQAQTKKQVQDLEVEVVGTGKPVLMVPGLNSAASVWRETCAALQPQVQCHIVQLPGFAGAKPAPPCVTACWPISRPRSCRPRWSSATAWVARWR